MDGYDNGEWKDSDEEFEGEDSGGAANPSELPRFKPTYVLVALDTGASMFIKEESGCYPFMACLDACYKVASSLVMAERGLVKGPLGIVLAENQASSASFVDFQNPLPDTVKLMNDLKVQTNDELKGKYQRKTDFDLADFFLFCKNKLTEIKEDMYKRVVVYITNDDNPVQNDARKRFRVINEAQKFANIHIDLKVFSFKQDFEAENFYQEILSAASAPPVEQINENNLFDKVSNLVQKKHTKLKAKFYPFPGDTERYFEVTVSKTVKSAYIPKNMYVTRDTQQEVKKTARNKEHTGTYSVKYSRKRSPLRISEKEKEYCTETNLPVGYTLYYVGEETLQQGWVIETPALMEQHFQETQPIFDIFWEFCREKSRCLFCFRKFKKGGKIRIVQLKPKYVNNTRMFLVKVLPYAREIHFAPSTPTSRTFSRNEIGAMAALVDELTFDFKSANFTDPVYGKKKAYIKSQLLDEPMEILPDCVPSDLELDQRVSKHVELLQRLHLVDDVAAKETKRKYTPRATRGKKARGGD